MKATQERQAVRPKDAVAWALQLPPVLDLDAAAALRAALLPGLGAGGVATLDGTLVATVDTACLQILCAFVRDCQQSDRMVRWTGLSTALGVTARHVGLMGHLGVVGGGPESHV